MNKEYIEYILKDEEMIKTISKLQTQCSHIMTEFYFFKIFFEALRTVGIICEIKHSVVSFSDVDDISNIKMNKNIMVVNGKDSMIVPIDDNTLSINIILYNRTKGDMSFAESTNALINIFISLFD